MTALAADSGSSKTVIKSDGNEVSTGWKLLYCSLLAVQFGLQGIITKIFLEENIPKCERPATSSIVIGSEIAKIFISLCSPEFYRSASTSSITLTDSLYWAFVPAALFASQNFLNYRGLEYTNAVTFNILNQLKILSAALFNWLLIPNKRFSLVQCFSLGLLGYVAFLLSSNDTSSSTNSKQISDDVYIIGVGCIILAAAISGLSGTLSQKAQITRSTYIYTVELGVYGVITVLLKDISELVYHSRSINSYFATLFDNWSIFTCIPVITAAIGGILVGKVTSALGAVEKGMSLIVGLFISTFAQQFWLNGTLDTSHYPAIVLVSIALYLYNRFPYESKPKYD